LEISLFQSRFQQKTKPITVNGTKLMDSMEPYPRLDTVRREMRLSWYRSPISSKRLRELSQRSNLQGWFQAGGHVSLFALTGGLVYLSWRFEEWLAFILALFLHGTVASFFAGIAPHELGHGTVFRTRWLNQLFLYPISTVSWFDPFDYNVSHTYHHRYTLHPAGDREVHLPLHPSVGKGFLLQMFTVNLFTERGRTFGKGGLLRAIVATLKNAIGKIDHPELPSHQWLKALHDDQPAEYRKSIWFSRWTLLFHGSLLVFSMLSGFWVLPLILTTASFTANWWAYFIGLTQHCGLRDNVSDFRKCVRSIRLDPFSEFLYWRMNWHTEHHMYAGVPCYNLKKLSRELAHDMAEPKSLRGAWSEMLGTWKRQQTEPEYQFDIPVPITSTKVRSENLEALADSVGDLAPDGLR
jgi:fatty acid desaturase